MKNNYFFKRILSAVMLLMVSSLMWAQFFEVDGIYYNVNEDGESVEVTSGSYGGYSGDIVIPSTVAYEGKTYNVTSIGYDAFCICSDLTSVVIPNSVTSIGSGAFNSCSSLTSVVIPNSVTSIEGRAYDGCSSLTSVEIPNSVTRIDVSVFSGCSSLTSITVADDNPNYDSREDCNAIIETVSNTLIAGCQNTVIPNSVTSIEERAFSGCYSLTSIEIPNSVTSIGYAAFEGCFSLASVEIPNGVERIENWTFGNCSSLTSVVIPNSMARIGDMAFYNCSSLATVTCYAEDVPEFVGSSVFANVPQNEATLYVPASALEDYKAADQWKEFGTILPMDGEATKIESTAAEQEADATYYTLDGVSVKNPTKKGIYIKNGKKVLFQ